MAREVAGSEVANRLKEQVSGTSGRGGIGRRAGFRSRSLRGWEFKSPRPHEPLTCLLSLNHLESSSADGVVSRAKRAHRPAPGRAVTVWHDDRRITWPRVARTRRRP